MRYWKVFSVYIFFLLGFWGYAQDDSEEDVAAATLFHKEEIKKEKKYLEFKEAYIESLKHKSKEDYDKALESLAVCESIYSDNKAVFFEKAKNLFRLKRYDESRYYCNKVLEKEPDNFWVLSLLRDVCEKENNYSEAIKIQNKLYLLKNTEAENLLRYYYVVKNKEAGKQLLKEVDAKNIYVAALDFYKRYFNNIPKTPANNYDSQGQKNITKTSVIKKKATFPEVKKVLKQAWNHKDMKKLLHESENALELFPAQALVYWYNGQALIGLQQYKKALDILEVGLDFIVDDDALSKDFYQSLIKTCAFLNKQKKLKYYQKRLQNL